jgi:dTDP-4-amino-4,6-dideoxygalactose transaminase
MREWVHAEYKKYIDIFEEESNRHGAIMYLSKKAQKIHETLDRFKIQHRYKHYGLFDPSSKFPQSIEIRNEIIDLPIHHDLSDAQIKMVCNLIRKVENE